MNKKILLLLCVLVVLLVQCTVNKTPQLKTPRLAAEYFEINVNRDTVLHAGKGAIINIPKGAISTNGDERVRLEVKEAYSIADMLLAGLTTKAGKDMLSSGGMFYINPAAGSSAKIVKPLAVSIPTAKQIEGMQLYKGELKGDSTINWVDPKPLPVQEPSPQFARGKVLFNSDCASCHRLLKDATGPPLALLDKRRDSSWLYHFVYSSAAMIARNEPYAVAIYERYNKAAMTAHPDLTTEDIKTIFYYLDAQVADIDPESIPDFKKSVDSCDSYLHLKYYYLEHRDKLVQDNGKLTEVVSHPINALAPVDSNTQRQVPPPPVENIVFPTSANSEYYKIKIETFGWYNIDILTKNLPGFENSELLVRVTGAYKNAITIYLMIPEKKIIIDGGLADGTTDMYCFYENNGKIPLPQQAKAYIVAVTEEKGQLYFGFTPFVTALKQTLDLKLAATTEGQMTATIERLNLPDFHWQVAKSKNADTMRSIDESLEQIEKLKPKNCNCPVNELADTMNIGASMIGRK